MGTKIQLDWEGLEEILLGDGIVKVEREIMETRLAEVRAQFVTDFGTEGEFILEERVTEPGRYGTARSAYKIAAGDARTTAILKRHPGWLNKFIQ